MYIYCETEYFVISWWGAPVVFSNGSVALHGVRKHTTCQCPADKISTIMMYTKTALLAKSLVRERLQKTQPHTCSCALSLSLSLSLSLTLSLSRWHGFACFRFTCHGSLSWTMARTPVVSRRSHMISVRPIRSVAPRCTLHERSLIHVMKRHHIVLCNSLSWS